MSCPSSTSRRARAEERSVSRTRPTVAQSQSRCSFPRGVDVDLPVTGDVAHHNGRARTDKYPVFALCELFALAVYQLEGRRALLGPVVGRSPVGGSHEPQTRRDRRRAAAEPLLEEIADLLGPPPLLGPVAFELRCDRDELVFSGVFHSRVTHRHFAART